MLKISTKKIRVVLFFNTFFLQNDSLRTASVFSTTAAAAGAVCAIHGQHLDFLIEFFGYCRPGGEAFLFECFVVKNLCIQCILWFLTLILVTAMALFLFVQFAGSAFDNASLHQDREKRPEETTAVEEETQILDIFAVEFRLDRNFQFVATVDLSPAGEAGTDVIGAVFVTLFNQIRLVPQGGSRSDDAHLPNEYVENLRQFVEACLPEEGADLRDVLLWILQKMRRDVMGRIDFHRAVFQDREELLVLPDALLAEEDWAWIADDDAQADDDPERYQNNDADARQDDVDEPFEKMLIHFLVVSD